MATIHLVRIDDIQLDQNKKAGWRQFQFKGLDFHSDIDQNFNDRILIFGYNGDDFKLSAWAFKQSCGLTRHSPVYADKKTLWATHKEYYEIGFVAQLKAHKERNANTSWIVLVARAETIKKKGIEQVFVVYLSNYDKKAAEIYKAYLDWYLNNNN